MTPELFQRFSDKVVEFVEGFFADANKSRDFDIEDPIFAFGGIVDDEFGITLFNDHDVFPFMKALSKHALIELFKTSAKTLLEKKPEARETLGTIILAGGWIKDPETLERIGENIVLTIEDPDRNVRFVSWTLTRPDEQNEPVRLLKVVNELYNDFHHATPGNFQNVFGLESRPEPEEAPN